jgi:NADPH:quinone reductase-like Zn-dependent oxidoreductase
MLKEPFLSPFVDQEIVVMLAHSNATDLAELASLVANGDLVPVIDQRYSLDDVREAVAYSEEGRARGKIIVHMD